MLSVKSDDVKAKIMDIEIFSPEARCCPSRFDRYGPLSKINSQPHVGRRKK